MIYPFVKIYKLNSFSNQLIIEWRLTAADLKRKKCVTNSLAVDPLDMPGISFLEFLLPISDRDSIVTWGSDA